MATTQQPPNPARPNSVPPDSTPTSNHEASAIERNDTAETHQSATVSAQAHPIRARLGLKEKPPIDDSHDEHPHQELLWSRVRMTLREPFAEFWGTAVMVFFGNGSVAQVVLSQGTAVVAAAPGGNGYGAYQSISWGWVIMGSCCVLRFQALTGCVDGRLGSCWESTSPETVAAT
jgi:hypothetical protein